MSNKEILFETLPFRITSQRYFGIIFRQLLVQWWSVLLLLLMAMVCATIFDLRFGIVILMFLFIILPLIVFMLYYNYALRPESFYSVVEKIVLIDAQGIDCVYDEKRRSILTWDKVERVVIQYDAYLIYTGRNTYFYLSRDAFASSEEMKNFEIFYLPKFMGKN